MNRTTVENPATNEDAGSRPRPWKRFTQWLFRSPRIDAPGRYTPRSPADTFTTPSLGDAYDFSVRIRWVWTGGQWDDRWLKEEVEPLKAAVWERLTVRARCTLRRFPPNLPAEAEAALNCEFTEMINSGQIPGSRAQWTARAEVTAHEAIRTQQQEAWTRYLGWANDHELAQQIVQDYAVMTKKWQELLAEVGIGTVPGVPPAFLGRDLIKLASDPSTAADVVEALSERREEKDRELLQTVADAVRGHDNLNLLEADTAYDTALRRLMDWAGLPLPELTERTFQNDDFR